MMFSLLDTIISVIWFPTRETRLSYVMAKCAKTINFTPGRESESSNIVAVSELIKYFDEKN